MPNVPDLDAQLDFDDDEPVLTKRVKLFKREWDLLVDANAFAATMITSSSADSSAFVGYMESMVVPEQWLDFRGELMKIRNLTAEKLWRIVNVMTEAIAEVPTTRPSASRPGPTKRTSGTKSKASSSPRRAATSRR